MATWVNYQQLRERLNFQTVLETYGVEVAYKGDQAIALCPFHEDSKSKSFSANLARGIFQCFSCKAKGNVLEFAVRMEGFDPSDGAQFREGAVKVQERFGGGNSKTANAKRDALEEKKPEKKRERRKRSLPKTGSAKTEGEGERVINAPLNFELKADPDHAYLKERKLTAETIAHFGVGYCNRGLMKGRVAIPLHDAEAELVGYAGRLVDDTAVDDDHPKYLFPGKREVEGIRHEFWKSEFLFNGHRFTKPVQDLVVVEGFFQCMWVHQCGFPNVVALMGSSVSEKQLILIRRMTLEDARVFVLPDGDDAGAKMAEQLLVEIGQQRLVRWLRLPGGNGPDDVSAESLQHLLGGVGVGL